MFSLVYLLLIDLFGTLVKAEKAYSSSQCGSKSSSNARGDVEDDYLLISSVQSVRECCSLLGSHPDYNVFVYCPNQHTYCFNKNNPQHNIPPNQCYLKYQHTVAQGNAPNVYYEGPDVDFESGHILYKNKGWSREVHDTFLNFVSNLDNKRLAAQYIYQVTVQSEGQETAQNIVSTIEQLNCPTIFQLLTEIDGLIVTESEADILQQVFSRSAYILECVDQNTQHSQATLVEPTDFTINERVANQNTCVEWFRGCIFLNQATKFLLDEAQFRCLPKRVCNSLGFQRLVICERECMQ